MDPKELSTAKKLVRAEARRLQKDFVVPSDLQIPQQLLRIDGWNSAETVMLYFAAPSEPPTDALIADCLERGVRVCAPVWNGIDYDLAPVWNIATRRVGPYGIYEPATDERFNPATVDAFVLPGLAFDKDGTRLGHGRGYMDRILSKRRIGALVIGLLFEYQMWPESLPRGVHDVAMSHLVIVDKERYK